MNAKPLLVTHQSPNKFLTTVQYVLALQGCFRSSVNFHHFYQCWLLCVTLNTMKRFRGKVIGCWVMSQGIQGLLGRL